MKSLMARLILCTHSKLSIQRIVENLSRELEALKVEVSKGSEDLLQVFTIRAINKLSLESIQKLYFYIYHLWK